MTRIADKRTRSSWEKAASFMRAVGSVVTHAGFVSKEAYEARLASCRSCEKIDRAPDGAEYCGACDCGRWSASRIDRKLYFPELECPLGRRGFVNEGHPTDPAAWGECKGCALPDPDTSPLDAGARVLIVVRMPNEAPDMRPWRVESRREDVYEIVRARRWLSWSWFWNLGRAERATVARTALERLWF